MADEFVGFCWCGMREEWGWWIVDKAGRGKSRSGWVSLFIKRGKGEGICLILIERRARWFFAKMKTRLWSDTSKGSKCDQVLNCEKIGMLVGSSLLYI
jgi:hypothetical protein